jgi:hypothetical protein
MIRIDEIWLSTQPMDMRAGMDTPNQFEVYTLIVRFTYPSF